MSRQALYSISGQSQANPVPERVAAFGPASAGSIGHSSLSLPAGEAISWRKT